LKANASNDYFIDQGGQRHDSYTGIEGRKSRISRLPKAWARSSITAWSISLPATSWSRTQAPPHSCRPGLADKGITQQAQIPMLTRPHGEVSSTRAGDRDWLEVFKIPFPPEGKGAS
jgi:hypothetical protein